MAGPQATVQRLRPVRRLSPQKATRLIARARALLDLAELGLRGPDREEVTRRRLETLRDELTSFLR